MGDWDGLFAATGMSSGASTGSFMGEGDVQQNASGPGMRSGGQAQGVGKPAKGPVDTNQHIVPMHDLEPLQRPGGDMMRGQGWQRPPGAQIPQGVGPIMGWDYKNPYQASYTADPLTIMRLQQLMGR